VRVRPRIPRRVLLLCALLPFVACVSGSNGPTTAPSSIALLAAHATLDVAIADGTLGVAISVPDGSLQSGPCPVLDQAQATMNGVPMSVQSEGSGVYEEIGDECGMSGNACTAPSFQAPFDPSKVSDVTIVISDKTGSMTVEVALPKQSITLASPTDGLLHVGQLANVAIDPPPPPGGYKPYLIIMFDPTSPDAGALADSGAGDADDSDAEDADASGAGDAGTSYAVDADSDDAGDAGGSVAVDADTEDAGNAGSSDASTMDGGGTSRSDGGVARAFECDTAEEGIGTCSSQQTSTGVSFIVPASPPGPGVLTVSGGFPSNSVVACTGVTACDVTYSVNNVARLETGIAP
jgi:hypothetical protein